MTRTYSRAADVAAAAALLRDHSDYRVLERLPRPYDDLPDLLPEGGRRIAILDVETEGLDSNAHAIIELALMHVAVDAQGAIIGHSRPQSWLQDPCRPLAPEIAALTGLSNSHLAGQVLDERTILGTLDKCDLAVAHNARFDLGFVDRQFPTTAGMPWACSCTEVPWQTFGMSSRKLEHLLADHGAFFTGHRAEADVWALFELLQMPVRAAAGAGEHAGKTYLQLLLQSSDAGAVRVRAERAPFSAKDWLKQRGFRWDADRRVWWKDDPMDDYLAEKAAFAAAGLPEPTGTMLDAVNRHRF
ncbi:MAG: DNA polymerase III subunit epsilon [Erythrobacter sp.]|nr:DNA polymerase III subunit epsilon [Erythrobacter sp.]